MPKYCTTNIVQQTNYNERKKLSTTHWIDAFENFNAKKKTTNSILSTTCFQSLLEVSRWWNVCAWCHTHLMVDTDTLYKNIVLLSSTVKSFMYLKISLSLSCPILSFVFLKLYSLRAFSLAFSTIICQNTHTQRQRKQERCYTLNAYVQNRFKGSTVTISKTVQSKDRKTRRKEDKKALLFQQYDTQYYFVLFELCNNTAATHAWKPLTWYVSYMLLFYNAFWHISVASAAAAAVVVMVGLWIGPLNK